MPRPNPTFWPVERPSLLAGGASSVEVDEGVGDGSTLDDVDEEEDFVLDRNDDWVGRVDVDVRLEPIVVGDSVGADSVALSLSLALEYCDCDQLVSTGSLVSVAVAEAVGHSQPVLSGGCVGQAVFGPNCLIR
jgi:hypothetical protein